MANRDLELLTEAAQLLKPLLNKVVFVGGCTGVTEYSGTLSLLTSVQLPNNLGSYTFTYDS
jgi:hypothetical protein